MTAAEQTTALLLEGAGEITRLSGQIERTREALRRLVSTMTTMHGHSAEAYEAWTDDPDLVKHPACAGCEAIARAEKVLGEAKPTDVCGCGHRWSDHRAISGCCAWVGGTMPEPCSCMKEEP